jgi:hypothetical protein
LRTSDEIPLWLKLAYGVATPLIAVVYWREYGPSNFLWLSDIALACTTIAVLTGNRLLASMPAIGVMPLELAWTVDFLAGGRLLDLAGYMFDPQYALYLRALSVFHLALPPTLIYLLLRLGYDRRAFAWQNLVTWAALIVAYVATDPAKNINWVFGPGKEPQQMLPPLVYLGLELAAFSLLVLLPMHLILKRLFGDARAVSL